MRRSYGTAATLATLTVTLAAPAGKAQAAEPIRLQIEGGHQQWVVVSRPELKDGQGEHAFDTAVVDQKHNSEVWFTGETLLSSGLTVGLTVQLEANTASDQIDESFLFLKSEPSGMLQLGDTDNAAYKMAVTAPSGGITVNDGDLVGIEAFPLPAGFDGTNTTIDSTPLSLTDDDSGKFSFYSPRYAGLQVGLSYIPQFEAGGDNNNSLATVNGNGRIKHGFAAAINYVGEIDDSGLSMSLGWLSGETPPGEGASDVWGLSAGLLVTWGALELGGSVAYANGDAPAGRSLDGYAYDLGIAYTTGPYRVGLTYIKGVSAGSRADSARQYLDQVSLSGTYALGPGVDLVAGLFVFDADGEKDVAGAGEVASSSGIGFASGLKVRF
ncbi:MAG: porin [Defluviicoccus sp.]